MFITFINLFNDKGRKTLHFTRLESSGSTYHGT